MAKVEWFGRSGSRRFLPRSRCVVEPLLRFAVRKRSRSCSASWARLRDREGGYTRMVSLAEFRLGDAGRKALIGLRR